MNLSQFPERLRSRVLSTVVRNLRAGYSIRLGKLKGEVLPLTIQQLEAKEDARLSRQELEQHARAAFEALPYRLSIEVSLNIVERPKL